MALEAFDDSLAKGKTDTGPGNLFAMETLEYPENLFMILGGNPNTIVGHRKAADIVLLLHGNMDEAGTFGAVLYAVTDKVLKELHKMRTVTPYDRQGVARYKRSALFYCHFHALDDFFKNKIQIDHFRRIHCFVYGGIGQQIRQQFPHPAGSIGDEADAYFSFIIKLPFIATHE